MNENAGTTNDERGREHELPLRDLPRLAHILRVLAKHGWGHYVDRLRLRRYLPGGNEERPSPAAADAQRLRSAAEELGPTFVKFGQLLSMHRDLLSEEMIQELQKLQDAVPPFPGEQARRIVEAELDRPVAELFAGFDEMPFAAASIGQVHAARRQDGALLVVKVQRPDIEQVIQADVGILFFIARLLLQHVPESRRFDPVGLVEEFAETIAAELDFRREGRNADRLRENFRGDPAVFVPQILWQLSGRRVLTMERSTGHKPTAGYPAERNERRRLAARLVRVFLTQLFEHGFFHGDPHPGNVFILDDGRLCFHDFGIVGRLSRHDQDDPRQVLLAGVTRDARWLADVYFDMGVATEDVDRDAFERDLDEALEQYYAVSAAGQSFSAMLHQFMHLGRRHRIRMPREFLLVAKAFMAVEAQAGSLDPHFDMLAALRDYALRSMGTPPESTLKHLQGYRVAHALGAAASGFPEVLTKALRQVQRGKAAVRVRHEQLEGLERRVERAANRLSFSLIIASIVVGSSIAMAFHTEPHYQGIPLVGLLGFIVAGALGLAWAVAILRSGKL